MEKSKVITIKRASFSAAFLAVLAVIGISACNKFNKEEVVDVPTSSSVSSSAPSSSSQADVTKEKVMTTKYAKSGYLIGDEYFKINELGLIKDLTEDQTKLMYQDINHIMGYYNYLYDGIMARKVYYLNDQLITAKNEAHFSFSVNGVDHESLIGKNNLVTCFNITVKDNKIYLNDVELTDSNKLDLLNKEIVRVFNLPLIPYYAIYATDNVVPYDETNKTKEDIFNSWLKSGLTEEQANQKFKDYLKELELEKRLPKAYRKRLEDVIALIKKQMNVDSYKLFDQAYQQLAIIDTKSKKGMSYNFNTKTVDLGSVDINSDDFVRIMKEVFTISKVDYQNKADLTAIISEFTTDNMTSKTLLGILVKKYGQEKVYDILADEGYTAMLKGLSHAYPDKFYDISKKLSDPNISNKDKDDLIKDLEDDLLGKTEDYEPSGPEKPTEPTEPPKEEDRPVTPPDGGGQTDETDKPEAKPDNNGGVPPKAEDQPTPPSADGSDKPTASPDDGATPPSVEAAPPQLVSFTDKEMLMFYRGKLIELVTEQTDNKVYHL